MQIAAFNLQGKRLENLSGKAKHHEVAGGMDTLTITANECNVKKGYRLMWLDKRGKYHEFIVASIDDIHDEDQISYEIYAENSLTSLKGNGLIMDNRFTDETGYRASQIIVQGTEWAATCEATGKGTFNFYHVTPFDALSELIKAIGCEFYTEILVEGQNITRVLHLVDRVGQDLGKRFSFSKDMAKVTRKVLEDDVITRLYPFGKGEESGDGYGRRINISEVNDGKLYVENKEAQAKYGYKGQPFSAAITFDNVEDKNELKEKALESLEQYSKPQVSYEADVVALSDYGYYFEGVGIGDSVRIRDKDLELAATGRVSEIESDPDGEEATSIKIGNIRDALGGELDEIKSTLDRVTAKEGKLDALANHDTFIDMVVDGLNDAFQNESSYAKFDPETGLTFTNRPDPATSTWALNLGSMGFRIANGKLPNGEWNWRTFGTGEGFTADLIRAGKLVGKRFSLDLENGNVNLADKIVINGEDGTVNIGTGLIGNEQLKDEVMDTVSGKITEETKGKADKEYLLSEINACAETVRIDGAKVIITGETHIDNGVIGSAQIKNGVITSAKIKSLDADDIKTGTFSSNRIDVGSINCNELSGNKFQFVSGALASGSSILRLTSSYVDIANSSSYRFGARFDTQAIRFRCYGEDMGRLGTTTSGSGGGTGLLLGVGSSWPLMIGHETSSNHYEPNFEAINNESIITGDIELRDRNGRLAVMIYDAQSATFPINIYADVDYQNHRLNDASLTNSSDPRLKKNIEEWDKAGIAETEKIKCRKFEWKDQERGPGKHYGVIAEEGNFISAPDKDGYLKIDLNKLTYLNLKTNQELIEENRELKKKVDKLEERLSRLEQFMEGQNDSK